MHFDVFLAPPQITCKANNTLTLTLQFWGPLAVTLNNITLARCARYLGMNLNREMAMASKDQILSKMGDALLVLAGKVQTASSGVDVAFAKSWAEVTLLVGQAYGSVQGNVNAAAAPLLAADTDVSLSRKDKTGSSSIAIASHESVVQRFKELQTRTVLDRFAVAATAPNYVLAVRNSTPDTFDEVAVFFSKNSGGIQLKNHFNLLSSGIATIVLDKCEDIKDYVIGIYIGSNLVARFPVEGTLTPQKAHEQQPNAPFCAKSFEVFVP